MKYFILTLALLCPIITSAQITLSGDIQDKSSSSQLEGANIRIYHESFDRITISSKDGSFSIQLAPGIYSVEVSYVGFKTERLQVDLQRSRHLAIGLNPLVLMTDEVLVRATRALDKTPMTSTSIDKAELEKVNYGQDMPFLLDQLPSVVTMSDAGAGIGYTGIRIRGTDATRINVTINGIPLNDPESQGVFWVDLPDLASSVDNIQVQRGVGTSTNGPGAFGATINVQTTSYHEKPYAEIINSIGSFNSRRHTISAGTGLLKDHFTVDARLSSVKSDGYIDRSFSDLNAYYVSAAYYGPNTLFKAIIFSGKERTYQAWWGVPEARLNNDIEGMQQIILNNGLNMEQAENLLTSGRTYNYYIYDNETDNYRQDHYQFLFAQDLTDQLTFQAALYNVHGEGFYEQYRWDDDFADYGLNDVIIGGDTIQSSDIIRRRWLDNDLYGANFSFDYYPTDKVQLILGGALSTYSGQHFGEIIWAGVAGDTEIRERFYDNLGEKSDFNVFAKANFLVSPKMNVFTDLQFRTVRYNIQGTDITQLPIAVDDVLEFVNPKVGVMYDLNSSSSIYSSLSVGNREPDRNDYVDAVGTIIPSPETLYDLELGYNRKGGRWDVGAVFYYMYYKNQLVLTGELNDVGAGIRTNVDDSQRLGLELLMKAQFGKKFVLNVNGTFSQNKIKEFQEILYDYGVNWDQYNIIVNTHSNTDISFSPNIIAGGVFSYYPVPSFEISWLSKYVSQQFLDNTSNESRVIEPYFVNNLRFIYTVTPIFMKEIGVSLLISNIFNELYESNGYTFGYLGGGNKIRENYLYPQAGTNYMASLILKF